MFCRKEKLKIKILYLFPELGIPTPLRGNVFNKDDYVKTALDKINNYKDLIKLKASLRNKIEASPIFDNDTFAKNFEDLLLKIHN